MIGIKLDEVPKSCWVCPINYTHCVKDGQPLKTYCPFLSMDVDKYREKRHKRCPLVGLKGENK